MASAPGWYPDPQGGGGQRYFDGSEWTDQTAPAASAFAVAPAPQPKKPFGCMKTILVIIGVLILLGLLGRACSHDDKSSSSSSSSSTASATPTPTPTGPVKPDATFTVGPGPNGDVVTATFAISDNFTEGMMKDGARFTTIDILKYAQQAYPNAAEVNVQGTFPMKDAYGNTSTDVVVNITYLKSTLDKINFAGVDKDKIWEIRDSGYIFPAFRP
jgi:Protein of unknown function (DUF2510)